MPRNLILIGTIVALVVLDWIGGPGFADIGVGPGGGTPGTSMNFQLVGHNPLFNRGMNAALAIYDHFAYIGNRTDGSNGCGVGDPRVEVPPSDACPHVQPGIVAVDIEDPANPTIAGTFGNEFAAGANAGQTSRELRVWPQQKLLIVMYFRCHPVLHACPPSPNAWQIRFFDLGANPTNSRVVATYVSPALPHEMFLWIDPKNPDRALLWLSTPTISTDPNIPNLIITDISRAREGVFTEVARGNWNQLYPGAVTPANYDSDLSLHSIGVSADGTRTYLAYLRGHLLILDTSNIADNTLPASQSLSLNGKLLTSIENRPTWGMSSSACMAECAESHSAAKFPGRAFVLTTDEVYGTFARLSFGCPWGWAHTIDVAQPNRPHVVGEYKIAKNACPADAPAAQQSTSYSSHNPTLTTNLAFITWHSGGLQAVDIADPARPTQAGWFSPAPLRSVATEDPALTRGPNKVALWSYAIIRNGLIYVIDIRNGLYILRYTGPRAAEVGDTRFMEGNSNLGDAVRIDMRARP